MQISMNLGLKIRAALAEEHIRHCEKTRQVKSFTVYRACEATHIPATTMNSYLNGKRVPGIVDLYEISKFTGITMDEFMAVFPSRVKLHQLWEQEQKEPYKAPLKVNTDLVNQNTGEES